MWAAAPNRTRIKICEVESLDAAWEIGCLGADALGFHILNGRPVDAAISRFAEILPHVSRAVDRVLLADVSYEELTRILEQLSFDSVQLYPDWSADVVARLRARFPALRILKVVSAQESENLLPDHGQVVRHYDASIDGYLLDSWRAGGTGKTADWDVCARFVASTERPVFLAGGLTADNVAEAIARVKPFGVDVESGVSVKLPTGPWVKSMRRVERFIDSVHRADRRR